MSFFMKYLKVIKMCWTKYLYLSSMSVCKETFVILRDTTCFILRHKVFLMLASHIVSLWDYLLKLKYIKLLKPRYPIRTFSCIYVFHTMHNRRASSLSLCSAVFLFVDKFTISSISLGLSFLTQNSEIIARET